MHINIVGKNIDLTEDVKDYALKKVTSLEKLLSGMEGNKGEVKVQFEVSKSTNHHKMGEVFHSDCSISIDGKNFYAESDNEDIHAAIDEVKEKLSNEITKHKDRRQTLMKRGAMSVKKMLKGLSKRNPFTSKY